MAHCDDCADQRGGGAVVPDLPHERLVDLDGVDRIPHKMGKGGETGPEIVECDADAACLQVPQIGRDTELVCEQRALRDLDLQKVRGQAGFCKDGIDLAEEFRLTEL